MFLFFLEEILYQALNPHWDAKQNTTVHLPQTELGLVFMNVFNSSIMCHWFLRLSSWTK